MDFRMKPESVLVFVLSVFCGYGQTGQPLIGTHNSATGEAGCGFVSTVVAPFATCQSKTLAEQYAGGVRFFDLRARKTSRGWVCAHGPWESKRSFESILAQLSSYSNAAARVWYEGNAPTGFVAQVEAWKRDYPGLDIVEAGSREPWRSLKVWRKLPQQHDYLGLDFSTWHTYLPIPWLWKKIYHDRPRFNSEIFTVVDFL